jgi:hypothetical protein
MKHRLDASVPDVPDTPRWEPFALVVLLSDAMHRFGDSGQSSLQLDS